MNGSPRFIKSDYLSKFWRSSTVGLSVFHGITQLSNLLISIALVKLASNISEISIYEQASLSTYFFSFFWMSGFIQAFQVKYKQIPGQIFSFYIIMLSLSVGFMVFMMILKPLVGLFFNENGHSLLLVFAIYVTLSLPVQILAYWYFNRKQIKELWLFTIGFNATKLLAFVTPLYFGYNIIWSFYGLIGTSFLWQMFMVFVFIKNKQLYWTPSFVKELHAKAWALSGYALLGSFTQLIPAWIISHTLNDQPSFAIYRYGSKEIPFLTGLLTSVTMSLLPGLANNIRQGLETVKLASSQLHHFIFPGIIILTWLSPWLFPFVFSMEFRPSALIFCILLLTVSTRLIFSQTILMALSSADVLIKAVIAELIVNALISWWLSCRIGLAGIAIGQVVGFIIEKTILMVHLKRKHGINLADYYPVYSGSIYNVILWLSVILVWRLFYA